MIFNAGAFFDYDYRKPLISLEWTAEVGLAYLAAGMTANLPIVKNALDNFIIVKEVVIDGKTYEVYGLPYASEGGIATGHGWSTIKGNPISLAGNKRR